MNQPAYTNKASLLEFKLSPGPPSVGYLIDLLGQTEGLARFQEVVQEFLPEHTQEIWRSTDRIRKFSDLFESKYFPLEEMCVDEDEYECLLMTVAIPRFGIGWDDYHELPFNMDSHMLFLMSLVDNPYYNDIDHKDGARVPMIEEIANKFGDELAKRIPAKGWEPEDLRNRVKDTFYEPVAFCGFWLWHSTDNIFWDICHEDEYVDLPWERECIDWLTEQWKESEILQKKLNAFVDWLKEDHRHLFHVIDFIEQRIEDTDIPPEQLTLANVFKEEHGRESLVTL